MVKIEQMIISANMQAEMNKDFGSIPGSIRDRVFTILNPQANWEDVLQEYMQNLLEDDYTYQKQNLRYAYYADDFVFPALCGGGLNEISLYNDSSGSVEDLEASAYIAEMNYIISELKPKKVTVAEFDTKLYPAEELEEYAELQDITQYGGGGTNITQVLDDINERQCDVAIVFTDGFFREYVPDNWDAELIWVIYDNPDFTYPVGKLFICLCTIN